MNDIDPILRLPQVAAIVGLRKTTVYKLIKQGDFPSPLRLSERASGWRESAIRAWIESREPAKRGG